MPNHITNELIAPKHIIDFLKSDESELDFNTIVPKPEIMNGEPHLRVTQWAEIAMGIINLKTLSLSTPDPLAAFERQDYGAASLRLKQANAIRAMTEGPFPIDWVEKDFESLIACMRALKEYGHVSWYEWCNAEWGTKWNAYDIERRSDTVIKFETAWSMPAKWFLKLVETFPNERISIRWADEDFGSNVGALTVEADGSVVGGPIENNSVEAHRVAMELNYGNVIPEHMKQEPDGRYSYTE